MQLEQMELEVMDMPAAKRGPLKERVTSYKNGLKQSERDLRKASVKMSNSQAARDQLFALDGSSEDAVSTPRCCSKNRAESRVDLVQVATASETPPANLLMV